MLHGVDLEPADTGLRLVDAPGLLVDWDEVLAALADAAPESSLGRERLARHVRARIALGRALPAPVRPYAAVADSPAHPGRDWVHHRVLGGVLEVGLGIAGLDPGRPEVIGPLPPSAGTSAAVARPAVFDAALAYLTDMGTLAVARLRREPVAPLRPMGDCDVVTLLADRGFRSALAAGAGGLRTAAVPMRERGWFDLRRVDPAFAAAAAAATDPDRRGFSRPLLVTVDEVVLAPLSAGPYPLPSSA